MSAQAPSATEGPRPVGVIGLGAMGVPMARRLLAAGFDVVAHSRSRPPVDALATEGARAAESPAEVAGLVELVLTALPDSPDVEAVVAGPAGILSGSRPGLVWVDVSTISPQATRRLAALAAESGVAALDAPVSGGTVGAREGTLSIMVGGEAATLERAQPVLAVLGAKIVHVGPAGAGQVAKAANQLIVGGTIAVVSEALTLARRLGADPAVVREALLGGFADSRILQVHAERMLAGTFDPGFRARLQRKDLAIGLEAGRATDTPLPVTAVVAELFSALCALGYGDRDHSSVAVLHALLAGEALP